jgi:uncharacterized protein (DUF2267 family)
VVRRRVIIAALSGAATVAVVAGVRARRHQIWRSMRRRQRYLEGRVRGLGYRVARRHPDPDVPDHVLAQRVRSVLGPIQKRLTTRRVHVIVCDHVVSLRGTVPSAEAAQTIVNATLGVSGVNSVISHLEVRAEPRLHAHPRRSRAYRRLRSTVAAFGVTGDAEIHRIVRAVLSTLLKRLPPGERVHVTCHLPDDVLALLGDLSGDASDIRDRRAFYAAVEAATGLEDTVPDLVGALLDELRMLVPEEVRDVEAVLPADLKELWRHPLVTV